MGDAAKTVSVSAEQMAEGQCPRDATGHCYHWWDAEGPCCRCGFDGELNNEGEALPNAWDAGPQQTRGEAMKNWCSQCGRKLTVKWACGPTHALLRLQWKKKQPQRGGGR